jgi:multidrug efflux pump subunit AcrB
VKSTYSYFSATQTFTRAYLATGYADDEGAQATRKKLREGLPPLPGAKLTLGGDDQSSSQAARLAVRLYGEAGARLDAVAQDVQRRLETVPGVTDVTIGGE